MVLIIVTAIAIINHHYMTFQHFIACTTIATN